MKIKFVTFGLALIAIAWAGATLAANKNIPANQVKEVKIMEACNATPQEKAGIEKALNYYIEAGEKGDSSIAKKGFAPTATMSWNENGEMKSVPIQALYDYFDEKPRKSAGDISACSIAGDVAIVRLESSSGDAKFTDMFTLVKDGDDWKIVSKVYHVKK